MPGDSVLEPRRADGGVKVLAEAADDFCGGEMLLPKPASSSAYDGGVGFTVLPGGDAGYGCGGTRVAESGGWLDDAAGDANPTSEARVGFSEWSDITSTTE